MDITFVEFLEDQEAKYGWINPLVETAMYRLTGELQRIAEVFRQVNVPFQVIGGVAVNAHLMACNRRAQTFVTRDVDLLVQRSELPRIAQAAQAAGYEAKKMRGGYAILRPGQELAEGVHLVFVGEKSHSSNPVPHPPIRAQNLPFFGVSFPVAALVDLVQMKLNSFRLKDRVHLHALDACGLITPRIEQQLPTVLKERLIATRQEAANEQPDIESP